MCIRDSISIIKKQDVYRSPQEKLDLLIDFVNSPKEDLPRLNKTYGFKDIRVRVRIFRNTLLKLGYEEELKQNGISIDPDVNPKLGSNMKN